MVIEWNNEKNELFKTMKGIDFEQIKAEIAAGRFIGPEINPARPDQQRIIVELNGYPVAVPFVMMKNGGCFLKTIYQSRKHKGEV